MLKGKIIFERSDIGSRNEWVYPFIQLDDGEMIKILVEDEDPFESETLRALEGKIVIAEGEISDSGAFIATEVKACEDEQPSEQPAEESAEEVEDELTEEDAEALAQAIASAIIDALSKAAEESTDTTENEEKSNDSL